MSQHPSKRIAAGSLAILLVSAIAMIAVYGLQPAGNSADVKIPDFSCDRAMLHVQAIAKEPHPVRSPAHADVQKYIVNELVLMGCQPEIQATSSVKNILVRLEGTEDNNKAVLVAGHYDTVPESPGAGDNSTAVAVMLETLRCLKSAPALRSDVIYLFSDAEETGLKGAEAFSYLHPWARDVGLVLNFDARGSKGPVVMFETSGENGWLIEEFGKAAPYPVASSLSQDVYRLLPNTTDFTVFKQAGFPGFNFAFMEGISAYHTSQDTIENLNRDTLHHQATYALPLIRHFANLDLEDRRGKDAVYFTLGSLLVFYSQRWVIPAAALVSLILLVAAFQGRRTGRLTLSGVVNGALTVVLNAIVTSVAVSAAWLVVSAFPNRLGSQNVGELAPALLLGLTSIGVASSFYVWFLRKRDKDVQNLMAGGLICWVAMTILTSLFLPGGSYMFSWPSLAGALGLVFLSALSSSQPNRVIGRAAHSVFALPAVILIVPMVYLTLIAVTLESLISVFVIAIPTVMILLFLTPQIEMLISPVKRSSV
jgi:peptidase M28-like protein